MRPINVEISAFGPYAGHTEIPMKDLGEQGLYLITGDTGAGKTTIFDAICFALYGEASGPSRDAAMFRSKYAAPETPTFVSLTFSHMGKEYTVKRIPEYFRPAKKGSGVTKQLAEAELTMPDGSVITKVRTVTLKVEEILGINREQFSQIAMLAQGDFLKLLLASTEERIKIFRDIFRTANYLTLQGNLDTKFKELYGKVSDGRKSIDQYISGIQVDKDNVLSIDVEKAKKGELVTEDVVTLLDKLTDEDSAEKDRLDDALREVSEELEEVNKRIGTAEAIEKAGRSREEAKERLESARPGCAELEQVFLQAKEALGGKADLEKKANKIENDLPKYDRTDALIKEIEALKKGLKKHREALAVKDEFRTQKSEELNSLKQEQAEFKDTSAEIEKIRGELKSTGDVSEDIRELQETLEGFFEDKDSYEQNQKLYIKENESFLELNARYESMDQSFRNAQAGILARDLKEGMECPVCGSKSHPRLAVLPDEVPTEKEVENARKDADKARKVRDKRSEELSGQKSALEKVREDIEKKSAKLLDTDNIEEARDAADKRLARISEKCLLLKKKLGEEEKRQKRGEELWKLIPELDKELTAIDSGIADEKAAISADEAREELGEKELKTLQSELAFTTSQEANKERKRLLKEAKVLQDTADAAEKDLADQKKLITDLEARISELDKTIKEAQVTDLESERKAQTELKDKQTGLISQGKIVSGRLDGNERTRASIIKSAASVAELEKELSWVKALSDTANGKLSGKDKVKLETYVQTTYFDRIISRANLRLVTMSGGQYELIRLKEADNAKSQTGLDLGVIDHYNGSQRSVRTLSGGESFMASLSLALGLSDEVQSSAGGIQIDTMFVDEGFGSLDPEALDMAYRALAGLIEGNRLVGIISHVADLKDRIDRQIVVTKEKSGGSKVRIV